MGVNFKNPPEMRDDLLYDDWKKELQIWSMFTDLEKKCQGPAIFLTVKGKAQEKILAEIKPTDTSKDNGVDTITASLDKLYMKNERASAFNAFENFSRFRRPSNMSIKGYMIDFNLRLCKIRSHAIDLPEDVLDYYLLSCANLSDEQSALCRATCMDLTYNDMKKQIERVSTNNESSTSTSTTQIEVKAEPQHLSQYDESEYYYREVENVKAEDAYYNKPGTWPRTSGVTRFASKPMDRLKKNPLDEFDNPAPCRFCKSIYHWAMPRCSCEECKHKRYTRETNYLV